MKKFSFALAALVASALAAGSIMAQPPQRGDGENPPPRERGDGERGPRDGERGPRDGEGGQRGPRDGEGGRGGFGGGFPNPLLSALDTDRDGELSTTEVNNATKTLKTLDKNGDGKITREEMRPEGMGGRGGFGGGPGGPGGGFNPEEMVNRMMQADTDGDGKISEKEAPERMREGFSRMDTNSDGFIDKKEIEAMSQRFQEGMRQRGGDGAREGGRDGARPEGEGGARPESRRPINRDDL